MVTEVLEGSGVIHLETIGLVVGLHFFALVPVKGYLSIGYMFLDNFNYLGQVRRKAIYIVNSLPQLAFRGLPEINQGLNGILDVDVASGDLWVDMSRIWFALSWLFDDAGPIVIIVGCRATWPRNY